MILTASRIGGCFLVIFFMTCWTWGAVPLQAQQVDIEAKSITVTDFRGKSITLEKPASRIVCLIESALSGLYMLGAGEMVVGVSTSAYQDGTVQYYRKLDPRFRAGAIPTPGNWDFINIEKVMELRPDLVVIWSHQEEAIRALEEHRIPVFAVFIKSFDDVFKEVNALGALTGCDERAAALINYTKTELRSLEEKISCKIKPVSVYFMWAQGDLETSGRPSTVQELIALAGGTNVAESIDQEHVVVNIERILKWNPEVILMWPDPWRRPRDIADNTVWKSVRAVRDSRVYQLPDIFSCDMWTLKFLYALKLAASLIHPEILPDMDPGAERTRMFYEFYRTPL